MLETGRSLETATGGRPSRCGSATTMKRSVEGHPHFENILHLFCISYIDDAFALEWLNSQNPFSQCGLKIFHAKIKIIRVKSL